MVIKRQNYRISQHLCGMEKYAVIVAGGSGLRMGAAIPKQFLLLRGKPLLYYSIKAFIDAFEDINIILVLPSAHFKEGESIITEGGFKNVVLTEGGETRFHSVQNGLDLIKEESIIFVHDGVRCLVSSDLIKRCYEQALELGSAIPAVSATDSIRIEEGNHHRIEDRNKVRIIQTPQTFQSNILLPAFRQNFQPAFTDEATVVEANGEKVFLIEGDYNNIKVTRPIDLVIAEQIFLGVSE